MDDARTVARQLGRPPRGRWRVAARCSFGHPTVITTAPLLEDGTVFPTLHYLTCPHLRDAVSALESAAECAAWAARLAADRRLAERLFAADAAYRVARAAEAGGADPAPEAGIAGQRDPLATKCLHAHVAAYLAGIDDPVGEGVLACLVRECAEDRCGEGGR